MNERIHALLPAALAGDTIEALHAELGPPRPWTYGAIVTLAAAALAALPLVRVDVTVRAPGVVRAATERSELRVAPGGRISRLWVPRNRHVEAGAPVLELAAHGLEERLAHNRTRQRHAHDVIHDLEILSTAAAGVAVHHQETAAAVVVTPPGLPDSAARPSDVVRTSLSPAATTGAVAAEASERAAAGDSFSHHPGRTLRTAELRAEWEQLRARLSAHAVASSRARTELERMTVLTRLGIAPQRELDDARFALARTEADAEILRKESLARWQSRLRSERLALIALVSEEAHLGDERNSFTLRAPVTGTVLGLDGLAEGAWVGPGQVIGSVSPDDALVVEAAVPPQRIGFVRRGQPVRLAVDTYAPTEWGLLEGTVREISADLHAAPGAPPHYRVLVTPQRPALVRPDGTSAPLRKGMSVTARFLVARRSLLQLLYEETSRWLDPRRTAAPAARISP